MMPNTRPIELERWEWRRIAAIIKAARKVVAHEDYDVVPEGIGSALDEMADALAGWDKNEDGE